MFREVFACFGEKIKKVKLGGEDSARLSWWTEGCKCQREGHKNPRGVRVEVGHKNPKGMWEWGISCRPSSGVTGLSTKPM